MLGPIAAAGAVLWLLLREAQKNAAKEGLELDIEALARTIQSESGSSPRFEAEQLAVASAVINKARETGERIVDQVTGGTRIWGRQSGSRYAATARPASEYTRRMAERVMKGGRDYAHGATHWFHPATQDKQHAAKKVRRSADMVLDDWVDGTKLYPQRAKIIPVPGTDPRRVLFLGPR